MIPEQLLAECHRKIAVWKEHVEEIPTLRPFINLVLIKRGRVGERAFLAGRGSPMGQIISWTEKDKYLVQFDPRKVIAWIEKNLETKS